MVFLLLSLIITFDVFASPAEEPKEFHIPLLDATQNLIGGRANFVANRVDSFFADQRADDELARSTIRVSHRYEVRERAELKKDTQFRFNIKLPQLEEKFKFTFEKKKKEIGDQDLTDQEVIIRKKLDTDWQFRSDVGINASIPPVVFTRGRIRKNFETGTIIHRFVEEIAWFSDTHWQESTTFDSDLSLDDNLLFRFRNTKDWDISDKEFSTSHGPNLFHTLTINDGFSYGVTASSVIVDSTWYLSNYRVAMTYRRNLYKHWIFMDLTPGLDFPKQWSFRRTPFVAMKVEALFGGI